MWMRMNHCAVYFKLTKEIFRFCTKFRLVMVITFLAKNTMHPLFKAIDLRFCNKTVRWPTNSFPYAFSVSFLRM